MKTLGIFIEQKNGEVHSVGLELLSEVKRLLPPEIKVVAIYCTHQISEKVITKISNCGADEIALVEHSKLETYNTNSYTKALEEVNKAYRFDVLLIGSTLVGRDLGPRLSARLHTGLTADATILEFNNHDNKLELLATRPALGGNLFAKIMCSDTLPQMATVRPGVFVIHASKKKQAKVISIQVELSEENQVKFISKRMLDQKGEDLTKASIIIAGGRGVATMFPELKQLAGIVKGQVAASRAVVDASIEPKDRLVGQTGSNVRPLVYCAFGISGAIQHVSGMDKSELIIAVNNDPNALIFNVADVSFVADAKKVIPLVINKINQIKNITTSDATYQNVTN